MLSNQRYLAPCHAPNVEAIYTSYRVAGGIAQHGKFKGGSLQELFTTTPFKAIGLYRVIKARLFTPMHTILVHCMLPYTYITA